MDETLKKLVVKLLKEKTHDIEVGNCVLTADEAMSIMSVISHEALSKEQAYRYLNMSRSKFDDKVAKKELPEGRKRLGHKELDCLEEKSEGEDYEFRGGYRKEMEDEPEYRGGRYGYRGGR